jgi:hypothetical protein
MRRLITYAVLFIAPSHCFTCAIGYTTRTRVIFDANSSYRDRNGVVRPVVDEKTFANALSDLHPDFDFARGVANSAKHLVLTNRRPHPASPSHAANTRVQSTSFGEGDYGTLRRNPTGYARRPRRAGSGIYRSRRIDIRDVAAAVAATQLATDMSSTVPEWTALAERLGTAAMEIFVPKHEELALSKSSPHCPADQTSMARADKSRTARPSTHTHQQI